MNNMMLPQLYAKRKRHRPWSVPKMWTETGISLPKHSSHSIIWPLEALNKKKCKTSNVNSRWTYGLPSAIGANDESQGLEECDDVPVFRVEAPDALYQHFINSTHLFSSGFLLLLLVIFLQIQSIRRKKYAPDYVKMITESGKGKGISSGEMAKKGKTE